MSGKSNKSQQPLQHVKKEQVATLSMSKSPGSPDSLDMVAFKQPEPAVADFEAKFVSQEKLDDELVVVPYKIDAEEKQDDDPFEKAKPEVRSRSSSEDSSSESSYSEDESSLANANKQKPPLKLPRKSLVDLAGLKRE